MPRLWCRDCTDKRVFQLIDTWNANLENVLCYLTGNKST